MDPVAIDWGADGKLWVVEMRDYPMGMDGKWKPGSRVKFLEDTNGDGKYDKATVLVDNLPFATGVMAWRKGALICAAPDILYAEEVGHGRDRHVEVKKIFTGFVTENYQARVNSLSLGLDNWIYSACYPVRFRNVDGELQSGPTSRRGEWGISQDDFGRIVYNSNEDQFRIDLVPAEYLLRNPNYRSSLGVDVDPIHDQTVWPARMNPGVNRGYWKGILRPDGTLALATSSSTTM